MRKREEIPVLVAEIKQELGKLTRLAEKLSGQAGNLENEERIDSAALRLDNFYTGCERIFRLIATEVNGALPETTDWHKRLLTQMSLEVAESRPAVISAETLKDLEELLGFRHVVRNGYGYELERERIEKLIESTLNLFPRLREGIRNFTGFLTELFEAVDDSIE